MSKWFDGNKKIWKWLAILSIGVNLFCFIVLLTKITNKIEEKISVSTNGGGYNYHANPYYDAYLSTFLLNDKKSNIVFLGDSITLGGKWEEFFPDKSILNRGIGSDVSEGILERFYEVERHAPNKIFLMVGCNDIAMDIPMDKTVENVEQILIKASRDLPKCTIYLQSILPSHLDNGKIRELNSAYKKLSEQYDNCIYINLYPLFLDEDGNPNDKYFAFDQVHLTGEGYFIWINEIKDLISA